jgi:hypothetical protein
VRIEPQCRRRKQIREHERYLRNKPVKLERKKTEKYDAFVRGTLGVRLLFPSSSLERVRQNLVELAFAKNGSSDRDKYSDIILSHIRARNDAQFADWTEGVDKTLVSDVNRVFADMKEKLEWTESAVRAMVTHKDMILAAITAACEAAPKAANAAALRARADVFLARDAAPDDDAAAADDEDDESDENDDDDESHGDAKNKIQVSAVAASKGEKTAIADDNEEEDEESSEEINVKKVRKFKKSKDSDGNKIDNEHDDGDENEETVDVRYQSTSSKRRRG